MTQQLSRAEIDGRGYSVSTAILYGVVTRLRGLEPGAEVSVRTGRLPAVDSDIRAWCRTTGHELVAVTEEGARERCCRIRRAGRPRPRPGWAFVVSRAGLEELLSPLGFALGAALGGSRVALYFQGPAARVPARGFTARLSGVHRAPFSVFARRGLARAGHPSPHRKLGQLQELGARFYVCGPSMEHFGVREEDLLFDDMTVAAYPTFVEEMQAPGVQLFP
ncbi:DsrE family protein [Streptomyces sp. F63]|uniref:DsrE family protein n=1 Tax=Streptomyces sp. F63 TaxID=2824887 RepID=UPI001B359C42|nr:DsrE family protein [Streptomyces sp. F63]MBQ0988314.1 DsrE family protein [Streptomyces sp. F63]